MAEAIGALRVEMSAGHAEFVRDMQKARKGVQDNAKGMQTAMKHAKNSFDSSVKSLINFRTIAVALGGLSVAGLVRMADNYTLLDNKLKLVTKSAEELETIQDGLYEQALRSHSSYASSVDLYSRFAKATETLGTSQAEVLRVTETLNKAMIISGATQEEAKNGIIQLSQGMASGVLRGEEFNSIMENGSRIARMLADYLKTDVGGLRKMAMEGKITSQIMIDAFSASAGTIDDEFGKMETTISQAITDLETVFGRLVSDSNKSAEGTKSVAIEIKNLAETIDQNREGIIELFSTIISLSTDAVRALANIGQSLQGWAAVKSGRLSLFEFATMGPDDLKKWLKENGSEVDALKAKISNLKDDLFKLESRPISSKYYQNQIAVKKKELEDLEKRLVAATAREVETGPDVQGANDSAITRMMKEVDSGTKATLDSLKKIQDAKSKAAQKEADSIKTRGEDAILRMQRELELTKNATALEEMRWETEKGRYADLLPAHKKLLLQYAEEKDRLAETERTAEALAATDEAIAEMMKEIDEGVKQSVNSIKELQDTGKELAEFQIQAYRNMQTAMADFFFDPFEDGLDGMLRNFVDVLRRMTAEWLATQAMMGLVGEEFGKSGKMGGLFGMAAKFITGLGSNGQAHGNAFHNGSIIPYAHGGVIDKPSIFPMAHGAGLMGEAGPEAILPLTRTSGGDLGVKTDGGGATTHNYFIQAMDAKSFFDVCSRNPEAINAQLLRGLRDNKTRSEMKALLR